jgi:anthranilate phosphoribosyltransferase
MAAVKAAVQAMVGDKRAITAEEAKSAMQDLFAGTSTQAQTGAFLTSLQVSPFDTRGVA